MIARRPDITESTVKVHVKHMLKKMKLKSRVEAAVWVHQERIFRHYSSGSSFQRGSSSGNETSGCTTASVISLDETRWPFASSTTAERCQRFVAPSASFRQA